MRGQGSLDLTVEEKRLRNLALFVISLHSLFGRAYLIVSMDVWGLDNIYFGIDNE